MVVVGEITLQGCETTSCFSKLIKNSRGVFPARLNQQFDSVSRRKSMGRHTWQSMHPSRKGANLSETSIAWILQFGSGSMPPAGEKLDSAAVV